MSKLFGWFSKNKKADKQKTQDIEEKQPVNESGSETELSGSSHADNAQLQENATETSESDTATEEAIADDNGAVEESPDTAPEKNIPSLADETESAELSESEDSDAASIQASSTDAVAEPQSSQTVTSNNNNTDISPEVNEVPVQKEKKSFFSRLKDSLSRTKANLGSGLVSLFKGKAIDDELYEDLETQLLVADVGMDTTQKIITHLTDSASRKELKDAEALFDILKQQMADMLSEVNIPLADEIDKHDVQQDGPYVILMVGVNGVGKTTTIGKLAKQFQQQGKKVMLAAGDTFRAAAVEQLQVWGERNDIPVIAQHTGADSASVLYDALEAAKSRKADILIADTAGRLQNKSNLMEELKKVVRVMKKLSPNAPHEVMLTLDAGTGQNAVSQAKLFNEAVGLTGITLTKLDGTAKGGVIFSIADQFGIPIRYIGVGEGIDDLRQFDGQQFIDALFSEN